MDVKSTKINWDVFLQSGSIVDALIEFIEGRTNNRELRAACRSEKCESEIDRMRVLGNHESRQQARQFLSQHYTWEPFGGEPQRVRQAISVRIDAAVADEMRAASKILREPLSELAERAIDAELKRLRRANNKGRPFKRPGG